MFDLNTFPPIIHHLRSISTIYKPTSGGKWIQLYCPYCNDSNRKLNPDHGHLYICTTFPYFTCFRCNKSGGLLYLLQNTGFNDNNILKYLKSLHTSNIYYNNYKQLKLSNNNIYYDELIKIHMDFKKLDLKKYNIFSKYIYNRCLNIDPIDFFIYPIIINGEVCCQFKNSNFDICTTRYLNKFNKQRYININKNYYYFQDIKLIINYNSIVISEGAFDLINLYNYFKQFKNSFFIAAGGAALHKLFNILLSQFLLIGKYTINIVLDNNYDFTNSIINGCKYYAQINPNIILQFWKPAMSKDVSDIMLLNQIEI